MTTPAPQAAQTWRLPSHAIALDRPRLLGILNITPDSFSDAGRYADPSAAADAAAQMVAAGVDALDIGGESTRPGAASIPPAEQLARILPVIAKIRAFAGPASQIPISIDTTLAQVAQAALDAGADALNDISAGLDSNGELFRIAARQRAGLILMHRALPPRSDSYSDRYMAPPIAGHALPVVRNFLAERLQAAQDAGCSPDSILLDPGLGFGKTVDQNLELIRQTPDLLALGRPILSALSRKSFTGRIGFARDSDPSERLPATLALSVLHLQAGARMFRVHDVPEHKQALSAAFAALSVP